MDIVLEQYRTRLQFVKKSAPATLIAFDKAARRFQQHLDALGRSALEMEPWDLETYLAGLGLAPTTVNTEWIHIGGALRYAHRRGMLPKDPTVDVYLAPPPRTLPKTIPAGELRAMKRRIHQDRQWLEFHLLAYTGMRQSEIRGLRWGSVDLAEGALLLTYTKTGLPRRVPIHPTLGEALAELRSDDADRFVVTTRGYSPVAYDTWMDDLRDFAPGYTAHWFRRTVTSSLLDNGVYEQDVKLILGWTPQTVMGKFYAKPSLSVMQRAILRLYLDDPV